jgi:hypothetical protein
VILPLGPLSFVDWKDLLPVIAHKMAKQNANEQGDPDPLLSQLAAMKAKIQEMSMRIHRMSQTMLEIQESLKLENDLDKPTDKEDTP